ncbi:hypothetical protein BB560_001080 [Smittium megazygosporum]|uniref:C2 domain-containing protein n=1 Tax=Smittium megazygosporum TaxID=133381 RepID=A0A2T9ZIN2_9FUNG|nr:hypothetical protein BB560_001080 [Smittium megazygosporum]
MTTDQPLQYNASHSKGAQRKTTKSLLPHPRSRENSSGLKIGLYSKPTTAITIENFNLVSKRADVHDMLLETHFLKSPLTNISNIKNSKFSFETDDKTTYIYSTKLAYLLESREQYNRNSGLIRQRRNPPNNRASFFLNQSSSFDIATSKNTKTKPIPPQKRNSSFAILGVRRSFIDQDNSFSFELESPLYNTSIPLEKPELPAKPAFKYNPISKPANDPNFRRSTFVNKINNIKNFTSSMFGIGNISRKKGTPVKEEQTPQPFLENQRNNNSIEEIQKNMTKTPDLSYTLAQQPQKNEYYPTYKSTLEYFKDKLHRASKKKSLHPLTALIYSKLFILLSQPSYIKTVSSHEDFSPLPLDIIRIIYMSASEQGISNKETLNSLVSHQINPLVEVLFPCIIKFVKDPSKAALLQQNFLLLIQNENKFYFYNRQHGNVNSAAPSNHPRSHTIPNMPTDNSETSNSLLAETNLNNSEKVFATWVQLAFNAISINFDKSIVSLESFSNESNLIKDLRICISLTQSDSSFVEQRDDFETLEAYNQWKLREITSLNQLIEIQVRKEAGNPNKVSSPKLSSFSSDSPSREFYFIPGNVFGHYRNLIKHAIFYDIMTPFSTVPDKNYTLSFEASKILKLAALTWRISGAFQVTCYLDIIKDYWMSNGLYIDYLYEAFGKVLKMMNLISLDLWSVSQQNYLGNVCKAIELKIISILEGIIEVPDAIDEDQVEIISKLYKYLDLISPEIISLKASSLDPQSKIKHQLYLKQFEQLIYSSVEYLYGKLYEEIGIKLHYDPVETIQYLEVVRQIESVYKIFKKAFKNLESQSSKVRLDISSIVLSILLKLFVSDLSCWIRSTSFQRSTQSDVETELALYSAIRSIVNISASNNYMVDFSIPLELLLSNATTRWMNILEIESSEWMRNSILLDKVNDIPHKASYSSSVIDLLTSFSQQISVASEIEWPNPKSYGLFLDRFCGILDSVFEKYTLSLEQQFLDIQKSIRISNQAPLDGYSQFQNVQSGVSNYEQNGIHLSPGEELNNTIHFNMELCTKLNNLYIAYDKIKDMIKRLKVKEVAQQLGRDARPKPNSPKISPHSVYIIEVVNAEEIELNNAHQELYEQTKTNVLVKFVMFLKDNTKTKKPITVGKTRPVPLNAMNPRWEEEFRIEPHPNLGILVTRNSVSEIQYPIRVEVCTQSMPGTFMKKDILHAKGVFYLSENLISTLDNSADIKVNLEPAGYVFLRVSLDSPVDDMEYYCERLLRKLNRTLIDLQQRIVEQASSSIRAYILRTLILARDQNKRSVGSFHSENGSGLKQSEFKRPISYMQNNNNGNINNPTSLSSSKPKELIVQTFSLIKKGFKRNTSFKLYKQEWEDDLVPAVEYLEKNLHILYTCLYEEIAINVILNIWKEILHTFEDFLLPELRGQKQLPNMKLSSNNLDHVFNLIEENYSLPSNDLENMYLLSAKSAILAKVPANKHVLKQRVSQNITSSSNSELSPNINEPRNLHTSAIPSNGHVLSQSVDENFLLENGRAHNRIQNQRALINFKGILGSFVSQSRNSDYKNSSSGEYRLSNSQVQPWDEPKIYDKAFPKEKTVDSYNSDSKRYKLLGFKKISLEVSEPNLDGNIDERSNSSIVLSDSKSGNTVVNSSQPQRKKTFIMTKHSFSHPLTAKEEFTLRKPEILLRLVRLQGDKKSLNFVKLQLEIKEKQLDLGIANL